jgi:hypothetical protein
MCRRFWWWICPSTEDHHHRGKPDPNGRKDGDHRPVPAVAAVSERDVLVRSPSLDPGVRPASRPL